MPGILLNWLFKFSFISCTCSGHSCCLRKGCICFTDRETNAKSVSNRCNFSEVLENNFLFSKLGERAERAKDDKTRICGKCS